MPTLYRFYDPRVMRSTLPFFSHPTAKGLFSNVVLNYLCEGVRLGQHGPRFGVAELYRYGLPEDVLLQQLAHAYPIKSEILPLSGHTLVESQPQTRNISLWTQDSQ